MFIYPTEKPPRNWILAGEWQWDWRWHPRLCVIWTKCTRHSIGLATPRFGFWASSCGVVGGCVYMHSPITPLIVLEGSWMVAKVSCCPPHIIGEIFRQNIWDCQSCPSTSSEQNTSRRSIYTFYFSKSTLPLLPLYKYEDCIEKRGTRMIVKYCAVWNTL